MTLLNMPCEEENAAASRRSEEKGEKEKLRLIGRGLAIKRSDGSLARATARFNPLHDASLAKVKDGVSNLQLFSVGFRFHRSSLRPKLRRTQAKWKGKKKITGWSLAVA